MEYTSGTAAMVTTRFASVLRTVERSQAALARDWPSSHASIDLSDRADLSPTRISVILNNLGAHVVFLIIIGGLLAAASGRGRLAVECFPAVLHRREKQRALSVLPRARDFALPRVSDDRRRDRLAPTPMLLRGRSRREAGQRRERPAHAPRVRRRHRSRASSAAFAQAALPRDSRRGLGA